MLPRAFISRHSCSCQRDIIPLPYPSLAASTLDQPRRRSRITRAGALAVSTYACDRNTRSDPCFLPALYVSRRITFPAGGMYHAGQSVPEGLLGGTCAFQKQAAVLEVVARAARYRVRWRTLAAPRPLRRHAGRQYQRIDDAEAAVPTAVPPIVTFLAGRR